MKPKSGPKGLGGPTPPRAVKPPVAPKRVTPADRGFGAKTSFRQFFRELEAEARAEGEEVWEELVKLRGLLKRARATITRTGKKRKKC